MRKALTLLAALTIAVLALPVLVLAASDDAQHEPSDAALDDIPLAYLALYREAAVSRCPGMPWSVLAAVGRVESDHGRMGGARLHPDGTVAPPIIGLALDGSPGLARIPDTDGGRWDADTVWDRAVGPMQFIPSTWRSYGIDASGSGVADPHNAIDAIHSAAAYLCEHGAGDPDTLRRALLAYNRSQEYVDRVLRYAAIYGSPSSPIVTPSPELIAVVLANPRITIYEGGRRDIATGQIDARVLTLLQLSAERYPITVSSLKTGHSRCIGGVEYDGCRVSHHWHGRAVDISRVDGHPVSSRNAAARRLAIWMGSLPDELRPREIGSPWGDLQGPGYFSDAAHLTHVHIGFAVPTGGR